jgi:hypothetical protein
MIIPPKWLENMPNGPAKTRAAKRFYMRLAGLYATENGKLTDLANLLGMHYQTLKSQNRHATLTNNTRTRIHKLVGYAVTIPPHVN